MIEKREVRGYILCALFLALIYVSFLIVQSFLSAIFSSCVLAYIFHPVYKSLNKKIKSKQVCAFFVSALMVVVIVLPLLILGNLIIKEAVSAYNSELILSADNILQKVFGSNSDLSSLVSNFISKALTYITKQAEDFIVSIPSKVFGFLIVIYAFFYLLISGESLVEKLKLALPFKEKEKLVRNLGETTNAIVYGIFVIALAQFVIASLGFEVLGISNPLLWGLVIGIFGLIPFLGPALVWIPFMVMNLLRGNYSTAVWITILGITLSLIDNIGRSWIIGKKSKMHPVVVLVGLIGGAALFGIVGVVVGPLVLSFVSVVVSEYGLGENKDEA